MKTAFTETGWDDYLYWQETDEDKVERINVLIRSIHSDPFRGIGKPEPGLGDGTNYQARRLYNSIGCACASSCPKDNICWWSDGGLFSESLRFSLRRCTQGLKLAIGKKYRPNSSK